MAKPLQAGSGSLKTICSITASQNQAAQDQADAANQPVTVAKVVTLPLNPTIGGGAATELKDYSLNLTDQVVTAGANGATYQLAQEMVTMAKKMLASGEITSEQSDKIMALANQGFRLAALEKAVENQSRASGSTGAFLGSSITFDGQTMTIPEVAGIIGFGTPTDLTEDVKNNGNYMMETTYASPETLKFLTLYNDATGPSGIQNADAKNIITKLSSEVSYLTDAVSNLIYGASDPNITLQDLTQNTASQATVYDSYGICYTGGASCKSNS